MANHDNSRTNIDWNGGVFNLAKEIISLNNRRSVVRTVSASSTNSPKVIGCHRQAAIRLFRNGNQPRASKRCGCSRWYSAVERARRTHTEEFYEVTESSFDLYELREELVEWERVYNTVRPHQALGYVTPLKFLEQRKAYSEREAMCH